MNEPIEHRRQRDKRISDVAARMRNQGHTGQGLLEAIQAHERVDRQELKRLGVPV